MKSHSVPVATSTPASAGEFSAAAFVESVHLPPPASQLSQVEFQKRLTSAEVETSGSSQEPSSSHVESMDSGASSKSRVFSPFLITLTFNYFNTFDRIWQLTPHPVLYFLVKSAGFCDFLLLSDCTATKIGSSLSCVHDQLGKTRDVTCRETGTVTKTEVTD